METIEPVCYQLVPFVGAMHLPFPHLTLLLQSIIIQMRLIEVIILCLSLIGIQPQNLKNQLQFQKLYEKSFPILGCLRICMSNY